MSDRLVRGILPGPGMRAAFVRVGDTARMSRALHGLAPTTARLFAEALAAGLVVAGLQKDRSRVNVQIECDGPARGFLVDASPEGRVRGYARAPAVHFPGDPRRGARAALGGSGFLQVLRDLGNGQFQRGAVSLREMEVAGDLRRWFAESEQVETALDIQVVPRGDEPLGEVAGILLQLLPGGDEAALVAARERLAAGALPAAVAAGAHPQEAIRTAAGEGFEVAADVEVAYACGCGPAAARAALPALGAEEVSEILEKEGRAVVTCEFCRQRYVVEEEDLRRVLARLQGARA